MIGTAASLLLCAAMLVLLAAWIYGLIHSDGKCNPDADCENCPVPCENHKNKRSRQ